MPMRRTARLSVLVAAAMALLVALCGCALIFATPEHLTKPVGLQATDGTFGDHVRVSWSAVEGATRYHVYRASGESAPYTMIGSTTNTEFDDQDVSLGIVYWYSVRACAEGACGPRSEPTSGYAELLDEHVPTAPTDIRATRGDHGNRVVVRWEAVEYATGYDIYRADEQAGTYTFIGTTTSISYADTEVTPGRTYWYRVRACSEVGCSELSPGRAWGFAAIAPEAEPLPPRVVSASEGDYTDKIHVTWTSSVGAEWYGVWRSDAQDDDYERIGDAESTMFDDTDTVASCTPYFYFVTACNTSGCSEPSRIAQGYRGRRMEDVLPPGNVQATYQNRDDHIKVTWNAVEGAVAYDVRITGPGIIGTMVETVDPEDGLVYKHTYDRATDVPQAEMEYTYRVVGVGVDDCGATESSISAVGRRRGNPLAASITDLEPECLNCPQAEAKDEDWRVGVNWEWAWKPWESPNPVQWFEVYRRAPGEVEFRRVGRLEPLFDPPLDYGLEEPDDAEDVVTYEQLWWDDDVERGSTYDYRVYAGRTIDGVDYFRRSGARSVRVRP